MVIRLDALVVWDNNQVRERLSWYYQVMRNQKPAKFLICKRVPCRLNLASAREDELWGEHDRLSNSLRQLQGRIASGDLTLNDLDEPEQNLLDLKNEILSRTLTHCTLCEWKCRVNRVDGGKKGACKLDSKARVSTWFHHFGEEAPLVGSGGSGTIFFTSCTFRCVFCQNWDISQEPLNGVPIDAQRLALVMKSLREEGAANINFVGGEPTPNLRVIVEGMKLLKTNVPMLWNSNMFCSLEAMKILSGLIDIWLPDFKYGNDACALKLSRIMNYFPVVARNHQMASSNGDMIIRHLVLPNHTECCTKPVLRWIAENCPRALVNIMGQYRPEHQVALQPEKYPEIAHRPSGDEMRRAESYAEELGIVYRPVS